MVPAVGALLALSAALAAACFVQAPSASPSSAGRAAPAAVSAHETDTHFARGDVSLAAAALPARRRPAGRSSSMRSRRWCRRWPAARVPLQTGAELALDRADRAKAAARITACWCSSSWWSSACSPPSRSIDLLRQARRGPAWDCGYPDPGPLTQYSGVELSRSRSAACSAACVFRARENGDHAAARRDPRRRAYRAHVARPDLGLRSTRPIAAGVGFVGRSPEPSAVPHHPPLSQPGVRRPGAAACWCWRYGRDPRPRSCRACRCCWCCCWRRCSPASCAR